MNASWKYGLIGSLLAVSLAVPGFPVFAADDDTATVKVRLAGYNGFYYETTLDVTAGSYKNAAGEVVKMEKPTAMGALVELLDEKGLSYVANTTAYGVYVTQIGDQKEKEITTNTGWSAYLNGQTPTVAADQVELHDGDEVVWAFNDWTQTLYPQVDLNGVTHVKVGDEFKVKVTAQKTTYDANWNATVTTVPVEGATVHVQGDEHLYVTDANGEALVDVERPGALRFYVDKTEEGTSLPLVIRSGWQQVIAAKPGVAFTDLNNYAWAKDSVAKLADLGAVVGDGKGHFLPNRAVTRAELAKMLVLAANLTLDGNKSFPDVTAAHAPYRAYIQAAAAAGLMIGDASGNFRPDAPISREELAVVLVRLANPESVPAIAANYKDLGQVKAYALQSVQIAHSLGLMVGNPDGTFRPQAAALRAEVAKALVNSLGK
jgi:hypothetical protein